MALHSPHTRALTFANLFTKKKKVAICPQADTGGCGKDGDGFRVQGSGFRVLDLGLGVRVWKGR